MRLTAVPLHRQHTAFHGISCQPGACKPGHSCATQWTCAPPTYPDQISRPVCGIENTRMLMAGWAVATAPCNDADLVSSLRASQHVSVRHWVAMLAAWPYARTRNRTRWPCARACPRLLGCIHTHTPRAPRECGVACRPGHTRCVAPRILWGGRPPRPRPCMPLHAT